MNRDQFLPEDARDAVVATRAGWTHIHEIEASYVSGDYYGTIFKAIELVKQCQELIKLEDKKKVESRADLIKNLNSNGINVALVLKSQGLL